MADDLDSIIDALKADSGLTAGTSGADFAAGIDAARDLNGVLTLMIDQTGVNDDGRITPADMQAISDALWEDANAKPWRDFFVAHGNDNGSVETGFHLLQGDGGTLVFQGRALVDTVIDAIYHFGFRIEDGHYVNEDGAQNEDVADVAGWLNYFLNGENIVYGSNASETLGSGEYSEALADARDETFLAEGGNDMIWADLGRDEVYGGAGNDQAGGGDGGDRLYGEDGADQLWGEAGSDSLYGGSGSDALGGGGGNDLLSGDRGGDRLDGEDGNDALSGGLKDDILYGGAGADTLDGGDDRDQLSGGDGGDVLKGGAGDDALAGGEGGDRLRGGTGADVITLWETAQVRDTLIFAPGESGRDAGRIDRVEGFESGIDRIDLTAFGHMTFESLDFEGHGQASCYYDGKMLRIDGNGDGATDMMVEFAWVDDLRATDLILA